MAWRKTGRYLPAEELLILTCDVCERDVGHDDGRRPREHFRISRHPNRGAIDDQEPAAVICSCECLRSFAASVTAPIRAEFRPDPLPGTRRTEPSE